jgi:predicted nucleotidyltransferase
MHPERWWYMSDLARHLRVRPSSLQRELAQMVGAGILRKRHEGNRVYFQADSDCPFFQDLQRIIIKTTGLVDVVREALQPLAKKIKVAFVYGSIARSDERSTSDIDLMVVGSLGLADLAPALKKAQKTLARMINPLLYSRDEFTRKAKARHHFLTAVLDQEKLFVMGSPRELDVILG